MRDKWDALTNTEQRQVLIIAVFMSIGLIYFALWQPLNTALTDTKTSLKRQQSLLMFVKENTETYQRNAHLLKGQKNGSNLSSTVNTTAQRKNIKISRIQPKGDELQLTIDEVPFNVLMEWLHQISVEQNIAVKNIDMGKTDTKGVVKVRRLTLGKI